MHSDENKKKHDYHYQEENGEIVYTKFQLYVPVSKLRRLYVSSRINCRHRNNKDSFIETLVSLA